VWSDRRARRRPAARTLTGSATAVSGIDVHVERSGSLSSGVLGVPGSIHRVAQNTRVAWSSVWAPLIASVAAFAVWQLGLRGADVPAQKYYVEVFRSYGWVLWDNGWYAGHYQVSYSVLFPPLGASLGLYGAALLSAATSAWAFARLVASSGERHVAVVMLFATGTVVAVAIGQLPFLAGLAAALLALLAAQRKHLIVALVFAASCSLFSEVAAVFLVVAAVAWTVVTPRAERATPLALGGAALAPIVVQSALFPPLGPFPFAGVDLAVLEGVCAVGVIALPRRYRMLRAGLALYGAVAFLVFVVPNPLGGNFARAVLYFAPPLFAFLSSLPGRRALALLVIPLLVWQYVPASSSLAADSSSESTYFTPVVHYLRSQPMPGRIEIPFTSAHWEAAYVAPTIPLARGWLRQQDIRDNPIFYASAPLNPTIYHQWLRENGVTWVALPDVALDYSAVNEASLLRHRQPYLRLVWRNAHWLVWKVTDSPGLVSGPAHITALQPDRIALDATATGTALVRVHFTSRWTVASGDACVLDRGGWIELIVRHPGQIELTASLFPGSRDCPVPKGT
jgi:hypothetical protein